MEDHTWVEEFPGAVTVCDTEGIILALNQAACGVFEQDGGKALIGSNVLDCHPESARKKLLEMMQSRQRNVYTIEKNGKHKLIYQSPWFIEGEYAGFVELSLEIPGELPHFVRKG
ncbi:MAG: PAS domain-containing protein [Chloroflexota bacterium]|jgi:transcriptional regulator with PAS, ATPase and Fis domain